MAVLVVRGLKVGVVVDEEEFVVEEEEAGEARRGETGKGETGEGEQGEGEQGEGEGEASRCFTLAARLGFETFFT